MVSSKQDFSRKLVIAIRPDLELWQVLNAVAHCAAYLGNKMDQPFDTGESFTSQDGTPHPRNTQYAIVTLSASKDDLSVLAKQARELEILHLGFIREMIDTTDDVEIESIVRNKSEAGVEYLAVGLFGGAKQLREITKHFKLWK